MKFSVLMSAWHPYELLEHAIACVEHQTHGEWELIVGSDGEMPKRYKRIVNLFRARLKDSVRLVEFQRKEGCYGNHVRRELMAHASGEYVVWVNHDNIIFPDYLQSHVENINESPGCVSVVPITLRVGGQSKGLWPAAIRIGRIDLLNFAIPLSLAREVNAFAVHEERVYAADWHVVGRSILRSKLIKSSRRSPVGIHF